MEDNYAKIFILFICCLPFWNRFLLRWVHNIAVEKLQTWPLHIAIWPWWQQCCICDYAVDWPGWFVAPWLWYCISFVDLVWSGCGGPSNALGRVLLEQKVEHQRWQRSGESIQWVRSNLHQIIFQYFLPEFYSSEPMVKNCSEACQLGKACVCSLCKCCINCCNKCTYTPHICHNHHNRWLCKSFESSVNFPQSTWKKVLWV